MHYLKILALSPFTISRVTTPFDHAHFSALATEQKIIFPQISIIIVMIDIKIGVF